MSCNRAVSEKVADGNLACYGIWDFGDAFGDDQNVCINEDSGATKIGCVISTNICNSGKATVNRVVDTFAPWHKQNSASVLANDLDILEISRNLGSDVSTVKKDLISVWEYRCGSSITERKSSTDIKSGTPSKVKSEMRTEKSIKVVMKDIQKAAEASGIHQFWFYPYGDDVAEEKKERRGKVRIRLFERMSSTIQPAPEGHGYILTV